MIVFSLRVYVGNEEKMDGSLDDIYFQSGFSRD